jgi:hypothetical protein
MDDTHLDVVREQGAEEGDGVFGAEVLERTRHVFDASRIGGPLWRCKLSTRATTQGVR